MTIKEEAPHVSSEEVLPLMQTLQLDMPHRQYRHPLRKRILLQLQRISPELIAIALVYFVQGILRLSSLAITFFEKDDLHMEPTQMAIADTIAGLPWTVKPLYGFITDSFPIRGMRRRPYLVLAGLVGTASWFSLAAFASTIPATIACITAAAAATAFSDVVADSIVVELARASPGATEGALQSLCWGAHAFGRVITAYLSGWLVHRAGVRAVFLITASFPLVVCLSSCLINEKKLAAGAADNPQHDQQESQSLITQRQQHGYDTARSGNNSGIGKATAAGSPAGEEAPLVLSSNKHPEVSPATPLGGNGVLPAGTYAHITALSTDHSHLPSTFELQQPQHWNDGALSKVSVSDRSHLSHRSSLTFEGSIGCNGTPRLSSRAQHSVQTELQQPLSKTLGSGDKTLLLGNACGVQGDDAGSKGKAAAAAAGWNWRGRQQYLQQALGGVVQSVGLFWSAVRQPHVLRPVTFLFLWQAMPNAGTAMFYFKTNQLHFDPEFFGRVKLLAALADLLGIVVYNSCLKQVRLRRLMLWGSLLGFALGLTPLMLVEGLNRQLGISDRAFALVDSALLSSIGQVLMMPTLVLSARLCPVGVEGTLYASLMSINNFAAGASDALGAVMMKLFGITSSNFMHLSALLVTCNILSLLPLPLIGWVPDETAAAAAAAALEQRTDADGAP